jgi:hypothetical protein
VVITDVAILLVFGRYQAAVFRDRHAAILLVLSRYQALVFRGRPPGVRKVECSCGEKLRKRPSRMIVERLQRFAEIGHLLATRFGIEPTIGTRIAFTLADS